MRKLWAFALAFCLIASAFATADVPIDGIGHTVAESSIASLKISVALDGTGLPDGRGTARQGKAIYESHCAACHGSHGEGIGDYPPLVGGRGTLNTDHPVLTVGSYWPYATTVWD